VSESLDNAIQPLVEVKLGNKTLHFKVDFNALAIVEEKLGNSMMDPDVWKNLNIRTVRTLTWAALLHENPKLTEHTVGSWLHMGNMNYVVESLAKAFQASQSEEDEIPMPGKGAADIPLSPESPTSPPESNG